MTLPKNQIAKKLEKKPTSKKNFGPNDPIEKSKETSQQMAAEKATTDLHHAPTGVFNHKNSNRGK